MTLITAYSRNIVIIACLLFSTVSMGQVGIGTTIPDQSSRLEVAATDKGFLPPRVALTSTNAAGNVIATPAIGLFVYNTATAGSGNTAVTPGYYYFNGTQWVKIAVDGNSLTKPSIITDAATNITSYSATLSGNVATDGGAVIVERGFYYGGVPSPNSYNGGNKIIVNLPAPGLGSFSAKVTNLLSLTPTLIYARAYAITDNGVTYYGNEISFAPLLSGYTGPAGGIVIYDKGYYSDGWRYLEAALTDQSTGTSWGCSGTLIGTYDSIGSGKGNTVAIINGCATAGIAAKVCTAYSVNGYTDWFLPSLEEFKVLYRYFGFNPNYYWTSTEVPAFPDSGAYYVFFADGTPFGASKSINERVRAIRSY